MAYERSPVDLRHDESRRLFAGLDRLRERCGGIVEVLGDPGLGKTRLLSVLTAEARRRGLPVFTGRCTEAEHDVPFQVFTHAVGNALDAVLDELPPGTTTMLRRVFDGRAHRVAGEGFLLHRALRTFLERCGRDGLLLVLDDLHWADPATLGLVEHLIRWPLDAPVLLVVAHRPRQASNLLRAALAHGMELGGVEQVELGELTLDQAAELLDRDPTEPDLADLHRDSAGNPLYLLAAASAGPGTGPQPELLLAERMSDQIAAMLSGEVATLSMLESTVAAAAAILGDVDVDAVAEVAQISLEESCLGVGALVRRDLLRSTGLASTFGWRHPVLRSVCYAGLDSCWRTAAHRRARAVLANRGASAGDQAVHVEYSLVGPDLDDLRLLTQAAEDAIDAAAPASAVHWLHVALSALPAGGVHEPMRNALAQTLTRALGVAGRLSEKRDMLREALAMVPPEPRSVRASAVAFCALMECGLGRYTDAVTLLDGELAGLPEDQSAEIVALSVARGLIDMLAGHPSSVERAEAALRVARRHGAGMTEACALALVGFCRAFTSDLTTAVETLSVTTALFDRLSDAESARNPECLLIQGWGEVFIGQFGDAERHFVAGLAAVERSGRAFLRPILLCGLSEARRHVGHLAHAQEAAAEARREAVGLHADHLHGLALALESLCMVWRMPRDSPEAIRVAERAMAAVGPDSGIWGTITVVPLAVALWLHGEPDRVGALLLTAGGGPELPDIPPVLRASCFQTLTAVSADLGDLAAADRWADRAGAAARDVSGRPEPDANAVLAQAHVLHAKHEPVAALALYRQAAGLLSTAAKTPQQAWTLVLAARCAAAADRPDEAAELLDTATRLARRCGACRVEEEAEEQTRGLAVAVGSAVNRRVPDTQLSALTDRERQVADLAGTGKTTREIAGQLCVSPRTIDVHLTRIYRKLNVRTRSALARLMAEIGQGAPS